ncbi:MAG: vWA domain-containing protein [Litoreibacter sp.]
MFLRTIKATGAAIALLMGAASAQAASIDLGFSLDESGSVGFTNFNLTRDALADALASIPTSGPDEFRLAVTTFSSGITTVIAPTVVTASNISGLQDTLRATAYSGGSTNTAGAITNLFNLFANSTTGLGDTSIINITTDGSPNSQFSTEQAAINANAAGLDGLSFEAVGSGLSSSTAQENLRRIAGLGTANDLSNAIITSDITNIPNALTTGFVLTVPTFAGFEAAIDAKITQVVIDAGEPQPSPVPLPAGLPLLLAALGGLGVMRKRNKKA